ncbi:MAG: outer membrane beta-barrel protein [Bacteroidetes bacterium]|nr:MAG: outer membrane beta-barrel protein [Bacteroidota bacterium]
MYRKFLLPMMLSLVSLAAFAQKTTITKADSNKLVIETAEGKTTIDMAGLSEMFKNMGAMEFKDWDFDDMDMCTDTPPTGDSSSLQEIVVVTTIKSDSGDYVEVITKNTKGEVKKVIRVPLDLVEDMGFDFENGDFVNKGKEPKPAKRLKNFESDWFAFDIGFNGLLHKGSPSMPTSLGNLELDPWRSVHVNVGIYQQKINLYRHYVNFVYGINYDNNDYRFSNDIDFRVDSLGTGIQYASRNTEGFKRNKLTTRFLTIPLALRFNFKPGSTRGGHITVGAHAGYRLTSFFKTVREDDGKRKNKLYDDFLLNNFRYGAFVKVGYGNVTLFGNYVFTPLFREGAGPELTPFSFGLSFGGF